MTSDNTKKNTEPTKDTIPSPSPVIIPLPLSTKADDKINAAFTLDLWSIPCPSRSEYLPEIAFKHIQSTTQATKLIVLVAANNWGWDYRLIHYAAHIRISCAASQLVAYCNCYLREFGHYKN